MATFKVALLALVLAFSATFLSVFSSNQQDWLKEAVNSNLDSEQSSSISSDRESSNLESASNTSSWDGKTLDPTVVTNILFRSAYFMKFHVLPQASKWKSRVLYSTVVRKEKDDLPPRKVVQLNLNYFITAKMLYRGSGSSLTADHDAAVKALMEGGNDGDGEKVWKLLASMLQKEIIDEAEMACASRAREEDQGKDQVRKRGNGSCEGRPFWDGVSCWIPMRHASNGGKGILSKRCPAYIENSHVEENATIACKEDSGTFSEADYSACRIEEFMQWKQEWTQWPKSEESGALEGKIYRVQDLVKNHPPSSSAQLIHQRDLFVLLHRRHQIPLELIRGFGSVITLGCTVPALLVLNYYKLFNSRLSCSRNTLHTQLFLSYAFRAIFSLLRSGYLALNQPTEAQVEAAAGSLVDRLDRLTTEQNLALNTSDLAKKLLVGLNRSVEEDYYGPVSLDLELQHWDSLELWNGDWTIRVIQLLTYYFIISNHSWLMMEGYYLHRILFNPLREKCSMKNIKRFGWFFGVPFSLAWLAGHTLFESSGQWIWSNSAWLSYLPVVPIYIADAVNLFFFLHIFVMLRNKLFSRISVGGTAHASTYRKLFYSTLSLTLLLGIAHQQSLLHFLVIQLAGWTTRGRLAWLYLSAIITGVQGALVAWLYCFYNAEVQDELRRNWSSSWCLLPSWLGGNGHGNSETGIGLSGSMTSSRIVTPTSSKNGAIKRMGCAHQKSVKRGGGGPNHQAAANAAVGNGNGGTGGSKKGSIGYATDSTGSGNGSASRSSRSSNSGVHQQGRILLEGSLTPPVEEAAAAVVPPHNGTPRVVIELSEVVMSTAEGEEQDSTSSSSSSSETSDSERANSHSHASFGKYFEGLQMADGIKVNHNQGDLGARKARVKKENFKK